MGMMFAVKSILPRLSGKFRPVQIRSFCRNKEVAGPSSLTQYDAYKELDNLNFMTAAKMLFSDPPKKKEFGLDFHLVQLFFACLPSLAVYLVAQYARYDMRRMEAEVELKKKAEEEAKAKEMEETATNAEKEETSDPKVSELKARLDKLEAAVKGIVAESKKESPVAIGGRDKQPPSLAEESSSRRNCDAENNPNQKKTKTTTTGESPAGPV